MPYGIAVDSSEEQVFWTDRKAGKIQRLSLRCSNGSLEVPSRMNSTMVKVGEGDGGWWDGSREGAIFPSKIEWDRIPTDP